MSSSVEVGAKHFPSGNGWHGKLQSHSAVLRVPAGELL
jgi:hypothetical protein